MYLLELYRDLKVWYKYSRITKSNRAKLSEAGLRVDLLGRLYTVINVPEELVNYPNIEMWVMQQLNPFNAILIELGIADYSFPEVQKLEEKDANAYLVLLYPELNYINFWRIVLEVAKWAGIIIGAKILYKLCLDHHMFEAASQFIQKYV
jgi:hypothetical protein